jgi:hypothetical protein
MYIKTYKNNGSFFMSSYPPQRIYCNRVYFRSVEILYNTTYLVVNFLFSIFFWVANYNKKKLKCKFLYRKNN